MTGRTGNRSTGKSKHNKIISEKFRISVVTFCPLEMQYTFHDGICRTRVLWPIYARGSALRGDPRPLIDVYLEIVNKSESD
jgi:hypothetical protein